MKKSPSEKEASQGRQGRNVPSSHAVAAGLIVLKLPLRRLNTLTPYLIHHCNAWGGNVLTRRYATGRIGGKKHEPTLNGEEME